MRPSKAPHDALKTLIMKPLKSVYSLIRPFKVKGLIRTLKGLILKPLKNSNR